MKEIVINKALAMRVRDVVSKGLTSGLGAPNPGHMCVEAAVNYACGLDHGDEPPCVGKSVRSFKIELNDCQWSNQKARAEGMMEVAIAQLGSNTIKQERFEKKLSTLLYSRMIPLAIEKDEIKGPRKEILDFLIAGVAKSKPSARADWKNELERWCDSNGYSQMESIITHKDSNPESFIGLLDIDGDSDLKFFADACRDVLIEMKSPGAKFLYLAK